MLVVARKEANRRLLEGFLDEQGLPVEGVSDLDELTLGEDPPAASIVDIDGYGEEIWAVIDRLRDAGSAVVVLTRYRTKKIQEATLRHPVRTVLEKPVRKAQLQAIVETLTD